jgi:very-short-patch-repair endonuclease
MLLPLHPSPMREGQNRTRARHLRKTATDAERLLWRQLRAKQLQGFRFRRQVSVGPYFADFACLEAKLIVEVDGGQHNQAGADSTRDQFLRSAGFRVMHVWNNEVMANISGVCDAILASLLAPPP